MKRSLLILLLLCLFVAAKAQTSVITGTVYDNATKEVVELAGIRILNSKDSTYVSGAAADMNGKFKFSVKPNRYILQITYLGYHDKFVDVNARRDAAVGNIYLDENSVLLNEAVVEAKAVEIQVKGDTVEYNADSYKVQESAVVEDLLKKMPGVEIDENGKITVNGKEVKKFLVDGKEFFSDDPKVASKNLPAKMVNKLQVVDRKSDMAQMTGFDDGEEETIINLTVKPGMKQGVFGNAFAGYGSEDKYEANGMINYMRNNSQVSALGGINNTNNAGFTDLASSLSSGRGRMRFGGRNGITKSINGGLNFATEHSDKLKWGGDFRYGNTDNNVNSKSITNYTTSRDPRLENSRSWGINKGENYGANLRFEWTPDSLTKIIFSPSVQYNVNDNYQNSDGETLFTNDPTKDYETLSRSDTHGKQYKLNGNLDLSRKLNDKGRVLSLGFRGGMDKSESDGFDYTELTYVSRNDSIIDQRFVQNDDKYNWRANLSYVEPLGRNNFLELSYSVRNNFSETDKKTYYNDGYDNYVDIDSLYTNYVKNDFLNQNISLKFRSSRDKFNYTLGVGLEPSSSKTTLYEPGKTDMSLPRKNFLSFAPSGQFNYLWSKNTNLRIDYKGTTNEPSTLQLYDGVYSRNGMNTTSGNPNLRPSFSNNLNIRFRNSNPQQGSFMMLIGRFNQTSNDIVSIFTRDSIGGRHTTYQNINGNMNGNLRFMFNKPLKNKKFSLNSMSYAGYNISNTFIDSEKNRAKTLNLQENIGLQFRSDKLDFGLRGNIQYTDMTNSISKSNNRHTFNYGGTTNFTYYLPFDFTMETDLQYSTSSGYSDGFKQNEWLWNASLSKQVLKDKAGTIRIKMYDILKERSNISRINAADNIQDITTNTISSYFMIHFIYKFQIFKGGAKGSDMNMGGGRERGGHPRF